MMMPQIDYIINKFLAFFRKNVKKRGKSQAKLCKKVPQEEFNNSQYVEIN